MGLNPHTCTHNRPPPPMWASTTSFLLPTACESLANPTCAYKSCIKCNHNQIHTNHINTKTLIQKKKFLIDNKHLKFQTKSWTITPIPIFWDEKCPWVPTRVYRYILRYLLIYIGVPLKQLKPNSLDSTMSINF